MSGLPVTAPIGGSATTARFTFSDELSVFHALTIARHPSETDERMMVRLLAFALNAHDDLVFGKGLSTDDEPALWRKDLTGAIELWIDVGTPDERDIRKACNRSAQVIVYSYGGRTADLWWQQNHNKLERLTNLTVINLPFTETQALARLAQRTMRLQCTIQDVQLWVADDRDRIEVNPVTLISMRPIMT
ncbi:MAG: YaeQ family protein [Gammaproteobacteria bacterium]